MISIQYWPSPCCVLRSLYQRPGAGATHVQSSSSETTEVSEVKLDNGLVHRAAQKSAALVCLIGIGKINLYNLHLSPCHLWLPVNVGRLLSAKLHGPF